jgi:hypothetical protein
MPGAKERLSEQAMQLAQSGKSTRLYTTTQVAKRLAVRSMTLMRWVVNGEVGCPAVHMSNTYGVHWLWNEGEIQSAAEYRKWAFKKKTHRRGKPR